MQRITNDPASVNDSSDELHDRREPGFYIIDDEIVEEYGSKLGPLGVAVYNVLVKHASRHGASCFPSYQTIADKLGISRNSAMKGVGRLLDAGLIGKQPRTAEDGAPASNVYTIRPVRKRSRSAGKSGELISPPSSKSAPPPRAKSAPRPVQELNHGSAKSAPKPDPLDQTRLNQTHTHPARERATRAEASASAAAGVCVGTRFSFEQRKAHAAAHGLGPGWLQRSRGGEYDELISDALASAASEAAERALNEKPSRRQMPYGAAERHILSILDVNPDTDIAGAVQHLDVSAEDRARLLAFDFSRHCATARTQRRSAPADGKLLAISPARPTTT